MVTRTFALALAMIVGSVMNASADTVVAADQIQQYALAARIAIANSSLACTNSVGNPTDVDLTGFIMNPSSLIIGSDQNAPTLTFQTESSVHRNIEVVTTNADGSSVQAVDLISSYLSTVNTGTILNPVITQQWVSMGTVHCAKVTN